MYEDSGTLPMDTISLLVKPRPEESSNEECFRDFPIVPPHLLAAFLLQKQRINFDSSKSLEFWRHHSRQATPLTRGIDPLDLSGLVEPFGLYSDEAEYSVSKEKFWLILCST